MTPPNKELRQSHEDLLTKAYNHIQANNSKMALKELNKIDESELTHKFKDKYHVARAIVFENENSLEAALIEFDKAFAFNPNDSNNHFQVSNIHLKLKNYELAFHHLERASEAFSKYPDLNEVYNDAAKQLGYESAIHQYQLQSGTVETLKFTQSIRDRASNFKNKSE